MEIQAASLRRRPAGGEGRRKSKGREKNRDLEGMSDWVDTKIMGPVWQIIFPPQPRPRSSRGRRLSDVAKSPNIHGDKHEMKGKHLWSHILGKIREGLAYKTFLILRGFLKEERTKLLEQTQKECQLYYVDIPTEDKLAPCQGTDSTIFRPAHQRLCGKMVFSLT